VFEATIFRRSCLSLNAIDFYRNIFSRKDLIQEMLVRIAYLWCLLMPKTRILWVKCAQLALYTYLHYGRTDVIFEYDVQYLIKFHITMTI
jgi:hypothetical protein